MDEGGMNRGFVFSRARILPLQRVDAIGNSSEPHAALLFHVGDRTGLVGQAEFLLYPALNHLVRHAVGVSVHVSSLSFTKSDPKWKKGRALCSARPQTSQLLSRSLTRYDLP